eukprot:gene12751-16001_t
MVCRHHPYSRWTVRTRSMFCRDHVLDPAGYLDARQQINSFVKAPKKAQVGRIMTTADKMGILGPQALATWSWNGRQCQSVDNFFLPLRKRIFIAPHQFRTCATAFFGP